MKYLVLCVAVLLPGAVAAEFALSDIAGHWEGVGVYQEGGASVRLRCRLEVTGDDTRAEMSGRCASPLGGRAVALTLARDTDGTLYVLGGSGPGSTDSRLETLRGVPGERRVLLTGRAEGETAQMEFILYPDGTLRWGARRTAETGGYTSIVTLSRR